MGKLGYCTILKTCNKKIHRLVDKFQEQQPRSRNSNTTNRKTDKNVILETELKIPVEPVKTVVD